jgi:hypothetical protein
MGTAVNETQRLAGDAPRTWKFNPLLVDGKASRVVEPPFFTGSDVRAPCWTRLNWCGVTRSKDHAESMRCDLKGQGK